jgi:hypothetical protein
MEITSIDSVKAHLKAHLDRCQLKSPICCQQNGCKSQFTYYDTYIRHYRDFHIGNDNSLEDLVDTSVVRNETSSSRAHTPDASSSCEELPYQDVADFNGHGDEEGTDVFDISGIKQQAIKMVIGMRGKTSVPYSFTTEILTYTTHLVNTVVDSIIGSVKLWSNTVTNLENSIEQLVVHGEQVKKIIPSLNSDYKINKLFTQHPQFVLPESRTIWKTSKERLTVDGIVTKEKTETIQYISIKSTIRALFRNFEYAKLLLKKPEPSPPGIYAGFVDGSRWRENPLLCDPTKIALPIQLFCDGIAITNPLNHHSSIHNCENFYFAFCHLPTRYNAALSNIHDVAICNSKLLKEHDGYEKVLKWIAEELTELSIHGIEVEVPGKGLLKVFLTLAQFVADNLGMNSALGLITCFRFGYNCIICYQTYDDRQQYDDESCFVFRTREEYEKDLEGLKSLGPSETHVRGIVRPCPLNTVPFWHLTANAINDMMHTTLEGVITVVMAVTLEHFKDKGLTLDSFNSRLLFIFSQVVVDKKNKPPILNGFPSADKGLSSTAAKNWALFRYFPLILCGLVDASTENFILILYLSELLDIVTADPVNEFMLLRYNYFYQRFITLFKKLYPLIPIRPKFHFMVHFPTIIRKNGPLRGFWCMNFERSNGDFKRPSHIMNNFQNPCLTLAFRRQCNHLRRLINNEFVRDTIEVSGSTFEVSGGQWQGNRLMNDVMSLSGKSTVTVTYKILIKGTMYRKGNFLVIDYDENGFIFGEINFIVCEELYEPLFVVSPLKTIDFQYESFCYVIETNPLANQRICKASDLLNYQPLDGIRFPHLPSVYIRLKHAIMIA